MILFKVILDKSRVAMALVSVAVLAGACSSSDGDGDLTATVAPNVHVNRYDPEQPLLRFHEGPAVLADRDDPDVVYLAESEMASGACRFYASTDRGQTWRPEAAPGLAPYTDNCAMGIATSQNLRTELLQAPDGTLYLVFQANAANRNGSRSVMLGRSSDGGRTWQTVPIDPGKPGPEPGVMMEVNFEGHLAFDPADPDHIYAMWRRSFNNKDRSPAPPTRPIMAVSQDGGDTWSAPKVMFEKNSGFDGPRPIVVGDELWAFYRESAATVPAGQPPAPTRLFAAVSTDDGATWVDHEIADALDASEPIPLYDRERRQFYVVWHDNREKELDAYFSKSSDGKTWSAPKLLNDDPRGTRVGQHYPQMSMSPGGRIDVAWYDWRDDPFPAPVPGASGFLGLFDNRGKVASVYVTSSPDGGGSWTANVQVNDVPIDRTIGTWINNADVLAPLSLTSIDDATIVAWSDTRNGNAQSQSQDIYTALVTYGQAEGGDDDVSPAAAGLVGGLLGLGLAMCLAFLLVRRGSARKA